MLIFTTRAFLHLCFRPSGLKTALYLPWLGVTFRLLGLAPRHHKLSIPHDGHKVAFPPRRPVCCSLRPTCWCCNHGGAIHVNMSFYNMSDNPLLVQAPRRSASSFGQMRHLFTCDLETKSKNRHVNIAVYPPQCSPYGDNKTNSVWKVALFPIDRRPGRGRHPHSNPSGPPWS